MIHRLNSLIVTERLYESMQPSGNDLRFAAIESNLAEYARNSVAWHWHEAVEFAWVAEGAVDCLTPLGEMTLSEGEGYFVNAGVLHMNRMPTGSRVSRFRILQFDASLLSIAGVIARQYVQPVARASALTSEVFTPESASGRAVLKDMADLFDAAATEPPGYEMRVVELLFRLWRHFFGMVAPKLGGDATVPDSQSRRIKAMLAFIHANYAQDIGVADIGAAANISEREAYRTFRQVLGTTPSAYLQQHRVNTAARLLTETGDGVTEIGMACGFSSPNYFSTAFRAQMGVSPSKFRRR